MRFSKNSISAFVVILGLGIAPGNARVLLNSSLSAVTTASAGEVYSGTIDLNNPGSEPATVRLNQTDFSFQSDGSNSYGPAGTQLRSNASWIELPADHVTVPAGTRISVSYTVTVPVDLDLRGTYWSIIMVEPLPEMSPELSGEILEEDGIRLRTIVRYGIQVITEIEGEAEARLEFLDPAFRSIDGGHNFSIVVRNPGERSLAPAVWLQLYDQNGLPVARSEADAVRLFPGCSVLFRLVFDDLSPGRYRGLIVADAGNNDVFGANLDIQVEANDPVPGTVPDG